MPRAAKYTSRDILSSAMREAGKGGLQDTLRQAFMLHQWHYYHTESPWYSPAGFPDIVAVKGQDMLVAECKRSGQKPGSAQAARLEAFRAVERVHTYLWYPADLDAALGVIARLGK